MADAITESIEKLVQTRMKDGREFVPARLQAALALLERLREYPSLNFDDHMASKSSSGLASHETFGDSAHARFNLGHLNKNHGRRSNELRTWGPEMLGLLNKANFAAVSSDSQSKLIDLAQAAIAAHLRAIIEQDPLEVRVRGRTAETVIQELLKQADAKGKSGDVAQYLVGAKLALRLKRDIPILPANKSDRKSRVDREARLGDFEIENAVIEVAVGPPDLKHVAQVADALEDTDKEVWLLTRADRVAAWKYELGLCEGLDKRRLVVTSVEAFVGQNITELGDFSNKGKQEQLRALFDIYNMKWISKVGTPGMRIEMKN